MSLKYIRKVRKLQEYDVKTWNISQKVSFTEFFMFQYKKSA